jgi:hypothetical protein
MRERVKRKMHRIVKEKRQRKGRKRRKKRNKMMSKPRWKKYLKQVQWLSCRSLGSRCKVDHRRGQSTFTVRPALVILSKATYIFTVTCS